MEERLRFDCREDWLASRSIGIGASEAAAIVGDSKFQTRAELWELKTGKREKRRASC